MVLNLRFTITLVKWLPGYSIFSFMCMICRSLFILLYFWSLCCLFFFDIQILITPLISSNSFYLMYRNEDHNRRGDHSPRRGSTDRRVTEYIYFRVKSQIHFKYIGFVVQNFHYLHGMQAFCNGFIIINLSVTF